RASVPSSTSEAELRGSLASRVSRRVRRAHRNPLVRTAHPTEWFMTLEIISSNKSFGGWHHRYRHHSATLNCDMVFAVYLPPQAEQGKKLPVLYWLSGLT